MSKPEKRYRPAEPIWPGVLPPILASGSRLTGMVEHCRSGRRDEKGRFSL